jgi:hypothetical protein
MVFSKYAKSSGSRTIEMPLSVLESATRIGVFVSLTRATHVPGESRPQISEIC